MLLPGSFVGFGGRAMTDLESEFATCLDLLDETHFARFAALGVPTRLTFGSRSLYGVRRIIPNPSGLFDFHPAGDWALVIAEGEPDLPGWLRRGQIDLLGGYNLDQPWRLEPTLLSATPLEWLRAGARGVCVLDWGNDCSRKLIGGQALVADSPALRERLQQRVIEAALEVFNNTVTDGYQEARNAARP
jgi:hypothetical protein